MLTGQPAITSLDYVMSSVVVRGLMVHARKPIRIEPGSELDRLLDEAGEAPLDLDRNGVHYRLQRVDTLLPAHIPPTREDVARSIVGIQQATGGWKDIVDTDAFAAYIQERRRTANRPSVRL
jgi:hypothetical protein